MGEVGVREGSFWGGNCSVSDYNSDDTDFHVLKSIELHTEREKLNVYV